MLSIFRGARERARFGVTEYGAGRETAIKRDEILSQIGTFTMFEMPTGNYDKGLGVGKVW